MTPILEFDHLSVRYGRLQAVDGVSLALAEGETLGLIGESGCGKSTLARAAVGLVPFKGAIRIEGKDAAAERRRDRRFLADRAQMLFQDPAASLSPRLTVRSLVAEPFRIRGRYGPEVEGWIAGRLGELGLGTDLLDRYPHQLSGGQARRVAIARVLAAEPRIIIADEPTAGLDVSVQGDILNLLAEMKRRRRLSYLVISHNLNVVGRVTDRVAVMYLGQIVEIGETARLFRQPAHPYTAALLSSNLSIHPRRGAERIVLKGDLPSPSDPPSGCRFHPRCPSARSLCARVDPALTDVSDGGQAACHFPLVQAPAASRPMLQAMAG